MSALGLSFLVLRDSFGICRLDKNATIPSWFSSSRFYSLTQTREEISIVCSLDDIPDDVKCEKGWSNLKVEGVLDFSLTGILASISTILSEEKISIFAISTYDTDYILVKETDLEKAVAVLKKAGHQVKYER